MKVRSFSTALLLVAAAGWAASGCGTRTERVSGGTGGPSGGEGEGEGGGVEAPPNHTEGSFESEEGTEEFDRTVESASAAVFAANISGTDIDLSFSLVEQAGAKVLACHLETAGTKLPASYPLGSDIDGNHCTYLVAEAAGTATYTSTGGALEITTCATATGELLKGKYDAITFEAEAAVGLPSAVTLNGEFGTELLAVNDGAVECEPPPAEGEGEGPAEGEGEGGADCRWNEDNLCQTEGQAPCCPYFICANECATGCITQCAATPEDFMCVFGCIGECMPPCEGKAAGACEPLKQKIDQCSEAAGCDDLEDDDDDAKLNCWTANCCDEVGAALGGE